MVTLSGSFWSCVEAVHHGGQSVVEQSCCLPGLMGTKERGGEGGRAPMFFSYLSSTTSPPPEVSTTSRKCHWSSFDSGINAPLWSHSGACCVLIMILKAAFHDRQCSEAM